MSFFCWSPLNPTPILSAVLKVMSSRKFWPSADHNACTSKFFHLGRFIFSHRIEYFENCKRKARRQVFLWLILTCTNPRHCRRLQSGCDINLFKARKLPEEGETIASKRVGAMWKIVHINYRIMHVLVLHELLHGICVCYFLDHWERG